MCACVHVCMRARLSPVPALLLHLILELHLPVQLFLKLVDPLLQVLQLDTDRQQTDVGVKTKLYSHNTKLYIE